MLWVNHFLTVTSIFLNKVKERVQVSLITVRFVITIESLLWWAVTSSVLHCHAYIYIILETCLAERERASERERRGTWEQYLLWLGAMCHTVHRKSPWLHIFLRVENSTRSDRLREEWVAEISYTITQVRIHGEEWKDWACPLSVLFARWSLPKV